MKKLGVLVPLVTPCTLEGDIDINGLKLVCDDMINAGCHGIFVAGSTGRGPWFTENKRMQICRTVANQIDDSKPILAGCMGVGLEEIVENAKAMADSGADFNVVTAPMYFTYSYTELEYLLLKFADASPLPVFIYDIPDFTGVEIGTQLLVKLAKHENIIGFKDSSANYKKFEHLLDTISNASPDFYLIQGKEHLLKDSLMAGASGLIVSLLHVRPELFVDLYNSVNKGDMKTAKQLQQSITKVMDSVKSCLAKRPGISTMFHFLNAALLMRGINVNICLEHEGECPDWISEQVMEVLQK